MTANPLKSLEIDMHEPLRARSRTLAKVEEVFEQLSGFRSFALAACAILLAVSLVNLGTAVGANILTRALVGSVPSNDADFVILTFRRGISARAAAATRLQRFCL